VGETADCDPFEKARTVLMADAQVIDNNHSPALPRDPNEVFVRT
jgi:hypothetical protein